MRFFEEIFKGILEGISVDIEYFYGNIPVLLVLLGSLVAHHLGIKNSNKSNPYDCAVNLEQQSK